MYMYVYNPHMSVQRSLRCMQGIHCEYIHLVYTHTYTCMCIIHTCIYIYMCVYIKGRERRPGRSRHMRWRRVVGTLDDTQLYITVHKRVVDQPSSLPNNKLNWCYLSNVLGFKIMQKSREILNWAWAPVGLPIITLHHQACDRISQTFRLRVCIMSATGQWQRTENKTGLKAFELKGWLADLTIACSDSLDQAGEHTERVSGGR